MAPGAIRPDGAIWQPAPGLPELTNTFRDGTLSELPRWLCEILRPQHRDDDAASKIDGEPQGREQAYAASVLEKCVAELEQTPPGNRNNRLNSVTYRLGRMIARNWIERHVVVSGLVAASRGLISDDGPESVRDTIESGLRAGIAHPHADLSEPNPDGSVQAVETNTPSPPLIPVIWDGDTPPKRTHWLVKDLVPASGFRIDGWGKPGGQNIRGD